VNSVSQLVTQFDDEVEQLNEDNKVAIPKTTRVIYVFCGVGTTWTGMCSEILQTCPLFLKAIQDIDRTFIPLAGWSIEEKLKYKTEMHEPMLCHICIFASQVGLATVWRHWGILPDAIVGQSVGEVAAAYVSGCLSLEDAVRVIYWRSLLLAKESGGKMVVVRNVSTDIIEDVCRNVTSGRVNIAVYRSPVCCTISGDVAAVDEVKSTLTEKQKGTLEIPVFYELPSVKCAYHSHQVNTAAKIIKDKLSDIVSNEPQVPVYSTVTGNLAGPNEFGNAFYWSENVKRPVMFFQTLIESSKEQEFNIFLEIGPKPVLRAHLADIFPKAKCTTCPSMLQKKEFQTLFATLKNLFSLGCNPQWENIVEMDSDMIELPMYQFDYIQLFAESDFRNLKRKGMEEGKKSQYLILSRKPDSDLFFKASIGPSNTPFVYDHIIDGVVILPGATYAEIAYELGIWLLESPPDYLQISYDIVAAVPISNGQTCDLDVSAEFAKDIDGCDIVTFTVSKDESVTATGVISLKKTSSTKHVILDELMGEQNHIEESPRLYQELSSYGYKYQEPVQVVKKIVFNQGECFAKLELTEEIRKQLNVTSFHPAVLDGMLHSSALVFLFETPRGAFKIYPIKLGCITMRKPLEQSMYCYTRTVQKMGDKIITNIVLVQEDGDVIAELKEVEHQVLDKTVNVNALAYQLHWKHEEYIYEEKYDFENGKLHGLMP